MKRSTLYYELLILLSLSIDNAFGNFLKSSQSHSHNGISSAGSLDWSPKSKSLWPEGSLPKPIETSIIRRRDDAALRLEGIILERREGKTAKSPASNAVKPKAPSPGSDNAPVSQRNGAKATKSSEHKQVKSKAKESRQSADVASCGSGKLRRRGGCFSKQSDKKSLAPGRHRTERTMSSSGRSEVDKRVKPSAGGKYGPSERSQSPSGSDPGSSFEVRRTNQSPPRTRHANRANYEITGPTSVKTEFSRISPKYARVEKGESAMVYVSDRKGFKSEITSQHGGRQMGQVTGQRLSIVPNAIPKSNFRASGRWEGREKNVIGANPLTVPPDGVGLLSESRIMASAASRAAKSTSSAIGAAVKGTARSEAARRPQESSLGETSQDAHMEFGGEGPLVSKLTARIKQ